MDIILNPITSYVCALRRDKTVIQICLHRHHGHCVRPHFLTKFVLTDMDIVRDPDQICLDWHHGRCPRPHFLTKFVLTDIMDVVRDPISWPNLSWQTWTLPETPSKCAVHCTGTRKLSKFVLTDIVDTVLDLHRHHGHCPKPHHMCMCICIAPGQESYPNLSWQTS